MIGTMSWLDWMIQTGGATVGSPNSVADQNSAQLEGNYFVLAMKFGNLTEAQARCNLELFVIKVRPAMDVGVAA